MASMAATDEEILSMANEMLEKLNVETRIKSRRDVDSELFVTLFEGICGESLRDVVRRPRTSEDHVHNIQVVIDTLSMDVLNTSLSHITGHDIVAGSSQAIHNLLEVLFGLMDFILEEISSGEESRSISRAESNVTISGDALYGISKPSDVEKSAGFVQTDIDRHFGSPYSRSPTERTSELIALGDSRYLSDSRDLNSRLDFNHNHIKSDLPMSPLSKIESRARTLHASTLSHRPASNLSAFAPAQPVNNSYSGINGSHPGVPSYSSQPILSSYLTNSNRGTESERYPHSSKYSTAPYSGLYSSNQTAGDSKTVQPLHYIDNNRFVDSDFGNYRGQEKVSSSIDKDHHLINLDGKAETTKPSKVTRKDDEMAGYSRTYEEYMNKYYNNDDKPVRVSAADESYLSDGCVDYQPTPQKRKEKSSSDSFGTELDKLKKELTRKAKAVKFEDHLDNAATERTGPLRRRFKEEEQRKRLRKELLGRTYEDELLELEGENKAELKDAQMSLKEKEADYEKLLKKTAAPSKKPNKPGRSRSVLIPRARPVRKKSAIRVNQKRARSASPTVNRTRMPQTGEELLPWLLEEFPSLQISADTLNSLSEKATKQFEYLTKTEAQAMRRKSKAQEQVEEAERRQKVLLESIKKQHNHQLRLKEEKERTKNDLIVQNRLRERRVQSARVRRYYDDYQVSQRSKMLKRRSKEELMFKQLFLDSLGIEKERILELRKYAKEQREMRAKKQKDELESIENFYRDKFDMMMEKMQTSRKEIELRDKEQAKVLDKMKRELRKKMEREIEELQQKIWADEDDIYFRELDAEKVRQQLNLTRYQTRM